jgi:hypothetical protein
MAQIVAGFRLSDVKKPEYQGLAKRQCSMCSERIWIGRPGQGGGVDVAAASGEQAVLLCIQCAASHPPGVVILEATSPTAGMKAAQIMQASIAPRYTKD